MDYKTILLVMIWPWSLLQPYIALKMTKIAVNEGINVNLKIELEIEARCFELLFSTKD